VEPDRKKDRRGGARDRVSGVEWRVAYALHPGSAVLEGKVWLINPGYVRQPFPGR